MNATKPQRSPPPRPLRRPPRPEKAQQNDFASLPTSALTSELAKLTRISATLLLQDGGEKLRARVEALQREIEARSLEDALGSLHMHCDPPDPAAAAAKLTKLTNGAPRPETESHTPPADGVAASTSEGRERGASGSTAGRGKPQRTAVAIPVALAADIEGRYAAAMRKAEEAARTRSEELTRRRRELAEARGASALPDRGLSGGDFDRAGPSEGAAVPAPAVPTAARDVATLAPGAAGDALASRFGPPRGASPANSESDGEGAKPYDVVTLPRRGGHGQGARPRGKGKGKGRGRGRGGGPTRPVAAAPKGPPLSPRSAFVAVDPSAGNDSEQDEAPLSFAWDAPSGSEDDGEDARSEREYD
eukprot:tig00000692_g3216.t1